MAFSQARNSLTYPNIWVPSNCSKRSIALRKEIAIIIVDHHLDLALALSDTIVAQERGQVLHRPSRALRDDLDLRRKVLWLRTDA